MKRKPAKNLIRRIILILLMVSSVPGLLLDASELGNKNLKGIRYVITAAEFNGVLYGEGYVDEMEETVKEFNLEEAVAKLNLDKIPITKETIRKIYGRMGASIQKAGMKVVKEKTYSQEKFTLIPTLTARIDSMRAEENRGTSYFVVIHLTLSKWISTWSGTTRILAPVYTWSDKKMVRADQDELIETIESAVTELTGEFLTELSKANREEKPVENVKL